MFLPDTSNDHKYFLTISIKSFCLRRNFEMKIHHYEQMTARYGVPFVMRFGLGFGFVLLQWWECDPNRTTWIEEFASLGNVWHGICWSMACEANGSLVSNVNVIQTMMIFAMDPVRVNSWPQRRHKLFRFHPYPRIVLLTQPNRCIYPSVPS
jgi:hypothetical protein